MKLYKISSLPKDPMEFANICRHKIGGSGAFCIVKECVTNHPTKTVDLKAESLYVVIVPRKTGFCAPILPKEKVGHTLLSVIVQ